MIYQLLKRDQAWKMAPYFLLLFVVGAALMEVVHAYMLMPLGVGLVAAAAGSLGQTQEGSRGFLAALPIERRDIFLARVCGLMALVWIPTCAAAGICGATGRFGAEVFLALAALATPLVLFHQSLLIRDVRLPVWASSVAVSLLCSAGIVSMGIRATVERIPVVPVLAASLLVSMGIFVRTWKGIPSVGAAGLFRPSAAAAVKAPRAFRPRRFPWWLFSWWDLVWFVVLFNLTFSGTWLSGVLFLWAGPIQSRERFRFLDSLPVGRRLLLAVRVAPLLLALVCGYLVGIHTGFAGTDPWNKVYVAAGREWPPTRNITQCGTLNVTPPLEYWRPAVAGAAPVVRAPWGESYQLPVVRVYGYPVYNPFGVGCENSRRFLDWQYERACLAVYGKLEPMHDPKVKGPVHFRTEILNIAGMLTCGLLIMLPLVLNDWWRFQRIRKAVRYTVLAVIWAVFLFLMMSPLLIKGMIERSFVPANAMQVVSWWLPENIAAVIAICVLVPAALYLLMQQVFLASEIGTWGQATQASWEIGRKL